MRNISTERTERTERSEPTRPMRWIRQGLVLALMTVLWATLEARAQMIPFVPAPVTTPELSRYADALDLSSAQRLAVLEAHDAYLAEFRELEDDEVVQLIEDLLRQARVFTQDGFQIPERSEFENLIELFDEILDKAKAIDRRLFDHVAGVLTDAQVATLPSVRLRRELDTYVQLMEVTSELNAGARVVLSTFVRELDLDDEARARIEPSLRQYERGAVARKRKLYRLLKEAATLALDTIDRTGIRDMTMMEMMELGQDEDFEADMRATFDEGSKALQAELFAASQQNLRLLAQLAPLLSSDARETLRDRYFRRAFARVYPGPSPWRASYARALALDTVDGERRREIEANRDQFRMREDLLIDGIVQRVEASRKFRSALELDEGSEKLEQRIETYRTDRKAIGDAAMSALSVLLTPDELASIDRSDADDDAPAHAVRIAAGGPGGGGGGGGETQVVVESEGADVRFSFGLPGMPGALTEDRRDELARLAGLGEQEQSVLEALHEDYREEFGAALERFEQEDDDAKDDDDDEGDDDEDGRGSKEHDERIAARMVALAAIDDALFDSIELVLPGEGSGAADVVRMARSLRARERATAAAQGSSFVFGREESYTDLVAVAIAMDSSVEVVAAAKPLIDQYAQTMGPLVDKRLDASREVQRRMRAMSRIMSKMQEGGSAGERMAEMLREKTRESRQRVKTLDGRIRDENRRRLDELMGTLEADLGWSLRMAYQRAAFPDVYDDDLGLDEALGAVQALEDLTSRQAEQVEGVIYDYRASFADLSDRMVQLRRERDFDFTAMRMPDNDVIMGEINLERLRFDRREAGSRAILRLRLVLTEAQIAESGLRKLPVPEPRTFD